MTSGAIQQGVPTNVLRDIMRLPHEPPRCKHVQSTQHIAVSGASGPVCREQPQLCGQRRQQGGSPAQPPCRQTATRVAKHHCSSAGLASRAQRAQRLTSRVAATPKSASSTWPLLSSRMLPACVPVTARADQTMVGTAGASRWAGCCTAFPNRVSMLLYSPQAPPCAAAPHRPALFAGQPPVSPTPPHLDVAVDDALSVQVLQRLEHVLHDRGNHRLLQALQAASLGGIQERVISRRQPS